MAPSRFSTCVPIILMLCVPHGNTQSGPGARALPIEEIKKTVVYLQGVFPCHEPHLVNGIQATAADGTPIFDTQCSQVGTGFLVIDPAPELGPGIGVPLLVTSKHLIRHQSLGAPKGTTEYFDTVQVLANTIQPNGAGSYIASIPIKVKDQGFLICSIDNEDPDADVAVCMINISDSVFDFEGLSPDMFVTKAKIQDMKLNETDEVLFSGLFLPYHGANKNYPIVRHGKLALIPKERIPWSNPTGGSSTQDLYLADITSWGGNSGSPVFVRRSGSQEQGFLMAGIQYLLLGVMEGYFYSDRPATLDTAEITDTAHLDVKLSDNSGIAAVVPAEKILDIIGQPRIKAYKSLVKAISLNKAGRTVEAEAAFKEAIETLRNSEPEHPLLKEALLDYAEFLRVAGRYPEAAFQARLANSVSRKASNLPDDQLR